MNLHKCILIVEYNFRILLVAISIITSSLFLILKDEIIKQLESEVSTHLGQITDSGLYDYGDYTSQVNNLIKNKSFRKDGEILNRYP